VYPFCRRYCASQGSTIEELERQWHLGTSPFLPLFSRNAWKSKTIIATVVVLLFAIDGPLLQRASTTVGGTKTTAKSGIAMIAPEVPSGAPKSWAQSGNATNGPTAFVSSSTSMEVIKDWARKEPIVSGGLICEGTCSGTILAPGVVRESCSTRSWPISYSDNFNPNATWGPWSGAVEDGSTLIRFLPCFQVIMFQDYDYLRKNGQIHNRRLVFGRTDISENGTGEYLESTCDLSPAILEYPFILEDGVITPDTGESEVRFVNAANNSIKTSGSTARDSEILHSVMSIVQTVSR
jgi:hypothetical protein